MDFVELGYFGLFIAAFVAATIVPFSSEVVFTALAFGGFDLWSCVLVATAGNWLGGMSCYYLGRVGRLDWINKYTGVNKEKLDRVANKIQKHGDWLAFFSFLPAVGDVIAVAAGFFRCNIWIASVSMLLGKFLRYVFWMYLNDLFI
ncbi:membrane protein [Bacteroidia bacterium]|nr:membrane protein [Bacteroidia bacterium]